MAKGGKKGAKRFLIRLVSSAGTGYFYTTVRAKGDYKLELKKRGIYKFTCKSNIKYIIKKLALKISTKLYLKYVLKANKWFYN